MVFVSHCLFQSVKCLPFFFFLLCLKKEQNDFCVMRSLLVVTMPLTVYLLQFHQSALYQSFLQCCGISLRKKTLCDFSLSTLVMPVRLFKGSSLGINFSLQHPGPTLSAVYAQRRALSSHGMRNIPGRYLKCKPAMKMCLVACNCLYTFMKLKVKKVYNCEFIFEVLHNVCFCFLLSRRQVQKSWSDVLG